MLPPKPQLVEPDLAITTGPERALGSLIKSCEEIYSKVEGMEQQRSGKVLLSPKFKSDLSDKLLELNALLTADETVGRDAVLFEMGRLGGFLEGLKAHVNTMADATKEYDDLRDEVGILMRFSGRVLSKSFMVANAELLGNFKKQCEEKETNQLKDMIAELTQVGEKLAGIAEADSDTMSDAAVIDAFDTLLSSLGMMRKLGFTEESWKKLELDGVSGPPRKLRLLLGKKCGSILNKLEEIQERQEKLGRPQSSTFSLKVKLGLFKKIEKFREMLQVGIEDDISDDAIISDLYAMVSFLDSSARGMQTMAEGFPALESEIAMAIDDVALEKAECNGELLGQSGGLSRTDLIQRSDRLIEGLEVHADLPDSNQLQQSIRQSIASVKGFQQDVSSGMPFRSRFDHLNEKLSASLPPDFEAIAVNDTKIRGEVEVILQELLASLHEEGRNRLERWLEESDRLERLEESDRPERLEESDIPERLEESDIPERLNAEITLLKGKLSQLDSSLLKKEVEKAISSIEKFKRGIENDLPQGFASPNSYYSYGRNSTILSESIRSLPLLNDSKSCEIIQEENKTTNSEIRDGLASLYTGFSGAAVLLTAV